MIRTSSAGFGRRFAALIYDGFLLIAVLMPYTWIVVLIHGSAVTEASGRLTWWVFRSGALVIMAAYYVLNWTRSGQTLGMRAWRLRTLSESGKPLQVGQAVARFCWGLRGLGAVRARGAVAVRRSRAPCRAGSAVAHPGGGVSAFSRSQPAYRIRGPRSGATRSARDSVRIAGRRSPRCAGSERTRRRASRR